jgi:diaminopimelate decarboxylase
MHDFRYVGNKLFCEAVAVEALARKFGTPLYVYSQNTLRDHYSKLYSAIADLTPQICFSVKSNSNLSVLRLLANLGSGFDVVSAGELRRVVAAGGDPTKCVFAGVGKTEDEIAFALQQNVYSFNAESEPELERIDEVAARLKRKAPVAVRVNPDVEAGGHKKITTGTYENKFGIAFEKVEGVYARAARLKSLQLRGIQMHIGSQITRVEPFEKAVSRVLPLVESLKKRYGIEFFSLGGGLGIIYESALASGAQTWWKSAEAVSEMGASPYADKLIPLLRPLGLRILIEPGRFITGNAGILVTRVEYVKRTGKKNFLITDAAMNDLIRPALYDAYHEIVPVNRGKGKRVVSDVVGPICESGDAFCHDRPLPASAAGDYLAIMSAGAYGSVMSSNYNTRPLAAEVLVNGKRVAVVRERQPVEAIWSGEKVAPWLSAA